MAKQTQYASIHAHNYTHADLHIICCQRNGLPRFVKKACLKRKVLGWILNLDRVGIFCRLASRELQIDGATKLNERSSKVFRLHFGILKIFSLDDQSVGEVCRCKVKLKGKREVYCRSDVTQKLLPCTCSGILQAASAVHLTAVLRDLAYVSSEQAMMNCSETSEIDPWVPHEDRPRLSCSNQGGRLRITLPLASSIVRPLLFVVVRCCSLPECVGWERLLMVSFSSCAEEQKLLLTRVEPLINRIANSRGMMLINRMTNPRGMMLITRTQIHEA